MPDLDLIKQGEQGVRDRRGRFARGLEDVLGTTVSVAQAKSQFAALVARSEAGERIAVTRNGRAVACLGPLPGGSRSNMASSVACSCRRI